MTKNKVNHWLMISKVQSVLGWVTHLPVLVNPFNFPSKSWFGKRPKRIQPYYKLLSRKIHFSDFRRTTSSNQCTHSAAWPDPGASWDITIFGKPRTMRRTHWLNHRWGTPRCPHLFRSILDVSSIEVHLDGDALPKGPKPWLRMVLQFGWHWIVMVKNG